MEVYLLIVILTCIRHTHTYMCQIAIKVGDIWENIYNFGFKKRGPKLPTQSGDNRSFFLIPLKPVVKVSHFFNHQLMFWISCQICNLSCVVKFNLSVRDWHFFIQNRG